MKKSKLIPSIMKKPLKKNKIFIRFFISYILILFIPLTLFPIIFEHSYKIIEEKELEMRSLLNKECSENMDTAIKKIDDTILTLEKNTCLSKLLYMDEQPGYGSKNVIYLYKAKTEMNSLISFANFNYDFALYIDKPDLVYNGSSISYGQERYYNQSVSYTDLSFSKFKKEVLEQYHNRDAIGNIEMVDKKESTKESGFLKKKGILYTVSLPFLSGSNQNHLATMVVLISNDVLDTLDYVPVGDYGCAFIEDENQNIIYGIYGDNFTLPAKDLKFSGLKGSYYKKINGQLSLITYTKSSYNNWCYVSISPIEEIMANISSLKNFFYCIMTIIFVVGLFLCFLFSRRNSTPLSEVLYTLQEKDGAEITSFSALGKQIHHMIINNEELSTAITEQKNKMIRAFYDRLFSGSFYDEEEIIANAKYLELDLNANMFAFILLSFGSAESNLEEATFSDKNIVHFFAEHLALPQMHFQTYTHVISIDRLGVLVFFPSADEQENRNLLKAEFHPKLLDMSEKFAEEIRCSCGNLYIHSSDISLSYHEAVMTMDHMINQTPNNMVNFYDNLEETSYYFYPSAIETKLKSLVSIGDSEGVKQLLDYIFSENLDKRSLSFRTIRSLFMDMQTGIIRLLQEFKINIHIHDLFKINANNINIENECTRIRDAYNQIISVYRNKPTDDRLFEEMLRYIDKNFSNNMLCVSMIAQEFHMSESCFSQYFKKYVNQPFSKYLETLRINKAWELIKQTDDTIEEISEKVGYSSALSFRRAFKKVVGMPPSAYR
jgi:two-component system, response regulator YesN